MESTFSWIPFYTELAEMLLYYKDDRTPLVEWIYDELGKVSRSNGKSLVAYLKMQNGSRIKDIDPFSVFGIFNRNTKWENRTELLDKFKEHFGLTSAVPTNFDAIPTLDNRRSFFFDWGPNNAKSNNDLWELYEKIVKGEDFEISFNKVIGNGTPKNLLTMCLYWIAPDRYLSLDSRNREYLSSFGLTDIKIRNYADYKNLLEKIKGMMNDGIIPHAKFYELSYAAWNATKNNQVVEDEPDDEEPAQTNPVAISGKRYWMYAAGENGSKWEECLNNGIMCLGWDPIGDLRQYKTIGDIQAKLQIEYHSPDKSFMNDRLALWEFCNVMKPGDIIYVKQGKSKILGRGIVTSDYYYDDSRDSYYNCRKVQWTHKGVWDAPHDTVLKTLTDLTKYPDYVIKLESLFAPSSHTKQYWWLVAKPKIWSLTSMKVGEVQSYSLYNENGNQRRVFQNFLNAKAGDIIVGYEATPTKQIVALLEVAKENDGNELWFRKTETLGTPIDYADLKNVQELKNMEFMVNPNGSLFKLTEDEYNTIIDLVHDANPVTPAKTISKYTKKEFLSEVFMEEKDFDTLKALLLRKKNIILQGAPGVGKTFAANRLAYAIMGEKDEQRIEQIQFHQNYSYEDFMMGYKPNEDGGFVMRTGVFYNFCKRATADDSNPYFFVIDEINRGNLSKIFGELLMLIESDYRDKPIKLSYRDEMFAVPSNVYIIGMMNTADRSLAMIDYALRRRFSFFEMKPGFESAGFRNYQKNINNNELDKVIGSVINLNKDIASDDSLGNGFCIGHSYFCGMQADKELPLRSIVEYDILPMLREYWFDDENKFKEEAQKLREALQ